MSHAQTYAIKMLCSYNIATYIPSILLQEVVLEEPATDGDSDHTDSGGSVVDSMEACE